MKIAYDAKLRRPGCVLLQAALGGTVPASLFDHLFDVDTWLVAPTPDLHLYPVTDDQLRRLSATSLKGEQP